MISFVEKKSLMEESKWETIGGVRIRKPNMELQKPHVVQGDNSSIYASDGAVASSSEQEPLVVEKVIRFLWDGNTILHEWEDDVSGSKKPQQKIDYQADYVVKLSEKKKQEAKEKTAKGEPAPERVGEKTFIPFRFQGQYEDEEIGLYYNRFRYYDPEVGQYTQQDPIGLAGENPTLYGYVYDTLNEIDPFGLTWRDLTLKSQMEFGLVILD